MSNPFLDALDIAIEDLRSSADRLQEYRDMFAGLMAGVQVPVVLDKPLPDPPGEPVVAPLFGSKPIFSADGVVDKAPPTTNRGKPVPASDALLAALAKRPHAWFSVGDLLEPMIAEGWQPQTNDPAKQRVAIGSRLTSLRNGGEIAFERHGARKILYRHKLGTVPPPPAPDVASDGTPAAVLRQIVLGIPDVWVSERNLLRDLHLRCPASKGGSVSMIRSLLTTFNDSEEIPLENRGKMWRYAQSMHDDY